MPRTVSSPGPKSHDFCGQRGFQEAQPLLGLRAWLGRPLAVDLYELLINIPAPCVAHPGRVGRPPRFLPTKRDMHIVDVTSDLKKPQRLLQGVTNADLARFIQQGDPVRATPRPRLVDRAHQRIYGIGR